MDDNSKNKGKNNVTQEKKSGGIVEFFKGLRGEFKRITWAPKNEVKKSILITLTFCFIYMVAIGVIDFGFAKLTKIIYG
ncbi:preprotein translocase subunit SecE [Clostridium cochlearium]|uniref:Protein translocase subunit SecE n=1 Tax=Clostridium cochlearium TaxID=1494 RepID=A0A7Y3Y0E7_CLOCO|nr:preprotein translocase subunit SecE [Clostridium cochlearium]NOH17213.1 preprotein translocase subunit SecE [Clostridium cochlearium]